ncbi:PucR family transcriptional regulator [Siminovitchia acidinfaciens]|uniref:PucR family transcriptional regulator n=1 Tax=Siminovitchia acidinfaciens TaxID=2321395 RepID=A0A429XWH2_9BACI|nr:helix-turn-helix domain-containing protein [Siminovitchia acidinfaciens]RST72735.1 PucR family transcriptional regulator [Siminovitchia acidinfaciens]
MDRLLEKIRSLTSIEEITEIISEYLKKPVVIEDEQFTLLAYSSFYIDQFDEANKQTIFTKRWTIPILEKFMDDGIVDQLKTIPEPFRVEKIEAIGLNQRVVVSARYKERVLGFIWVQETDHLLTDEEFGYLQEVSFHVGKLLYQKKQLKLKRDEEKNNFYKKVMDDTFQTEAQIKWEAANVNISMPDSFISIVFAVDPTSEEAFGELIEKVGLFANALKMPTHLFIDQLKVIVMIGSSLSSPKDLSIQANALVSSVLAQFSEEQVYAGISREYTSVIHLRKSYMEAIEVIRTAKFIGMEELPSFEYQKLGLFRYLEAIFHYQKQMDDVNPDLLKLKQKDDESQTSLLQTLEVYLEENCRLKHAAKKLYIHTNTLKYRLNQIEELTSIRFDDFHANCQLYIDLQIMKVSGGKSFSGG